MALAFRPPSYNPRSPSYDPSAASPCNPFPTTSPFAAVSFSPSNNSVSYHSPAAAEMDVNADSGLMQPPTPLTIQIATSTLARIPPPHSAPSLRRTKLCRFYLSPAGCKTGRWCNFKHPVESYSAPHSDSNPDSSYNYTLENAPDVRDLDPNWGKKSDDEIHPKFRTQPCRNYMLGLCRYGPKCQFIHAPGVFAPGTAEIPTSLPIHAGSIPVSVWGPHPGVGVSAAESSPGGKSDQINFQYRTKPCHYFNSSGTCPHSSDCKFIHDPKKAASTPSSALSWADDDRELDFDDVPMFGGSQENHSPVRNVAMGDVTNNVDRTGSKPRTRRANTVDGCKQEHQGGIYKCLWRVVGGGVKIGKSDPQMHAEDRDDDMVLEYQPRDVGTSVSHSTPSPDFIYKSFDLAQHPSHSLLQSPSHTDAPLDIVMGHLEGDDKDSNVPRRRNSRVITRVALTCAVYGGEEDKEREKPQLTIAVPSPRSWTRATHTQEIVVRDSSGDDVLDWGDGECDDQDCYASEYDEKHTWVLRRAKSTPPTPRSSSSLSDAPVLPRMSAESP